MKLLVIGLLGTLIFGALACSLYLDTQSFKANAVLTTGIIVDFYTTTSKNNQIYYYPIVQFQAQDGKTYLVKLQSKSNYKPVAGTTYTLIYDKNNPNRVNIDNFIENGFINLILALVAFVFACVTISSARAWIKNTRR